MSLWSGDRYHVTINNVPYTFVYSDDGWVTEYIDNVRVPKKERKTISSVYESTDKGKEKGIIDCYCKNCKWYIHVTSGYSYCIFNNPKTEETQAFSTCPNWTDIGCGFPLPDKIMVGVDWLATNRRRDG